MSRSREELQCYIQELEERVERLDAECSLLTKELESLSYSVSHDLRAPLRSIHGFSKILLNKYQDKLDETGQNYLQRVMRASEHMGELIEDLLMLSRLSRTELVLEQVDMQLLAKQVIQELHEAVDDRDDCVEIDSLPAAFGDRKLLGVVLTNLLDNALKFSSKEAQPCIRISAQEQNGKVTYTVSDNGVGFDMAYSDKLFGAFQRLHGIDEFDGSGIGLAAVQRILVRHGSTIDAESEPGKGARFHFVLDAFHG